MSALSQLNAMLASALFGCFVGSPVGVVLALRLYRLDALSGKQELYKRYLPTLVGVGPLGSGVMKLARVDDVSVVGFLTAYFGAVALFVVPTGVQLLLRALAKRRVRKRIRNLPERDRGVISQLVEHQHPGTVVEVAHRHGVSEKHARALIRSFFARSKVSRSTMQKDTRDALAKLSAEERELLRLRFGKRPLSEAEIARQKDMSIRDVQRVIRRALQNYRDLLQRRP